MGKWEYKVVYNTAYVRKDEQEPRLNEFGAKGWELMLLEPNQAVFKRRKRWWRR